jgi:hypothetical protein
MAHLAPRAVELARKVFAAITADIAAGKQPHRIVESVRAALVAALSREDISARCCANTGGCGLPADVDF